MRVERVGPRIWAIGALAALSVGDPGLFTRYGIIVALIVWITGSPWRFRTDRVFWATLATIGWSALTLLWAINPDAPGVVLTAAAIAGTFLLSRDAIRTLPQLRIVAVGYLLGALVAVVRVMSGSFDPTTDRYSLVGLNANYLGYALIGALAVVVLLWNTGGRRRTRIVLVVTVVAALVGLQLTDTRGALVGAVCLTAWLLLCRIMKRPPVALLVTIVSVVAVIIATGFLDEWLRTIEFGDRATGDWSGRLILWPFARELWADNWFIGSGPNTMRVNTFMGIDAHNVILEYGTAQGIIGVILFVVFLATALGYATRQGEPRTRAILIGSFIAAMAPAYLTGAWEASPAAWVLVMLFSRVGLFGNAEKAAVQAQKDERARRHSSFVTRSTSGTPNRTTPGATRPQ